MPQITEHSLLKTKETPFPILGYLYIQHRRDRTSKACHRCDKTSVFCMPIIIEKERHLKLNHLGLLYKSFILTYLGWQEFLESPYNI